MSEWQNPKTDWDTTPVAFTGAVMNRIEGNIDYLKNTFPYEIFFISGTSAGSAGSVLMQPYFVNLPAGYELRLLSANYRIITDGAAITLGDDVDGDKYFDSSQHDSGALVNEVILNEVMESNTTGSDMSVNLGVYTSISASCGWSFKLAKVKL